MIKTCLDILKGGIVSLVKADQRLRQLQNPWVIPLENLTTPGVLGFRRQAEHGTG
jgi:hypothetical protein